MADANAPNAAGVDVEVTDTGLDVERLLNDPALAWRLAQEARSSGKWALASKLVRIAREAGDRVAAQ